MGKKYNVLTKKGAHQTSHMVKVPFQKHMVGTFALIVIGFNYTKRYYTMPHAHKDDNKPMLMFNGELHPFEDQPASNAPWFVPTSVVWLKRKMLGQGAIVPP